MKKANFKIKRLDKETIRKRRSKICQYQQHHIVFT